MTLEETVKSISTREKNRRDYYQAKANKYQKITDKLNKDLKILDDPSFVSSLQKKFDICLEEIKETGITFIDTPSLDGAHWVSAEYQKGEVKIPGRCVIDIVYLEAKVAITFRPEGSWEHIIRVSMGERLFKRVEIIQYLMKKAGGK